MKPVFISYARRASADHAKALHQALGADSFLDERDIDFGEQFPEIIVDALLGSRVIVVFADETYFERPVCRWELQTALGPVALTAESMVRPEAHSLDHMVMVLPADGNRPAKFDLLPPALTSGNWPRGSDTGAIAKLVRERLAATTSPVSQLYTEGGRTLEFVKRRLLDVAATPPTRDLKGVRTYPSTLRRPLDTFVGRSHDLWRINSALSMPRSGAGAAQVVSIEGGAGFGKSTLAREYLHRLAPARFPGGLFWINAEEALDAQFHGVLKTLIPTVPELPDFQRQRRDVRKELEKALADEAEKAPILWVVDNVPEKKELSPEEACPQLEESCPAFGKVAVLATSRRKLSAIGQSVSLPIDVLDAPSAVDLLVAGLSPTPPLRESEVVAKWVGRLPVALVVLNASLRSRRLSLDELVSAAQGPEGTTTRLDEEWTAWGKRGFEGLPAGVHQAFGLSYERLSPETQEGARLIAQLAPSPIPFQLVEHLALSRAARNDLVELSFVGDVDPEPRDAQSALPMFGTMNRVLADYLCSRATNEAAEVKRAVGAVTDTLNDALKARGQWRVLLHCAPHAQHLFELTRRAAGAQQILIEMRPILGGALSSGFVELGRREEALATVQEAVEAFRPLANARPDAFEPCLAGSLNNLSECLSALGRREEALAAIENAVDIRHRLAMARPAAFAPDLAMSLNNLSNCLGNLGRREDALAASEGAVEIRRRLAKARPDAFEPDLAASLNNLSNHLSLLGRREDALAAIQDAVDIRRRLTKAHPAAFEPDLAMSLNNLSACLGDLGRREDALAAIQDAVDIRRRLTKARPAAFEPDLAMSLNNLSNRLGDLGRREDALAAIRDAVDIRRRLAKARPAAFEPDLAISLNDLSGRLSDLGRREDALAAIQDAVEIFSRIAKTWPQAFEPDLAGSLNNLSIHLSHLGRREDALAAIQDAVDIRRRLAKARPAAFEPDLAMSLNNLSNRLGDLGRREDALAAIQDAVDIRRRLAKARPAAFEPNLAMSLNNLSARLSDLGRREDALAAIQDAVEIFSRLTKTWPEAFEPKLANSLVLPGQFRDRRGGEVVI